MVGDAPGFQLEFSANIRPFAEVPVGSVGPSGGVPFVFFCSFLTPFFRPFVTAFASSVFALALVVIGLIVSVFSAATSCVSMTGFSSESPAGVGSTFCAHGSLICASRSLSVRQSRPVHSIMKSET